MMNKPGNPDVTLDLSALMTEAAHRIDFSVEMLRIVEEPATIAPQDFGGYEFSVIREILKDVANMLKAVAEQVPA